jgi:hypothetical protein
MKRQGKKICQVRENGSKQQRKKERKNKLNLLDCVEPSLIKNEIACLSQREIKILELNTSAISVTSNSRESHSLLCVNYE